MNIGNIIRKKPKAFTLAEVLVTLAIIGVVAALTIPTLVKDYQKRQYETSQKVLMTNLRTALRNMQVADKLMGYNTTAEFVDELQKYLKITKVCSANNLSDCFGGEFVNQEGEVVKIDDVKTARDFGKEYDDENIGIATVNGITAIVTYNPECNVSGMNFQDAHSMSCLGMMYDLNGKSNPNKIATDVKFFNAVLSNSCVGLKVGGKCFLTNDIKISSYTAAYGQNVKPVYSYDCSDMGGRLPTTAELHALFSSNSSEVADAFDSQYKYTGSTIGVKLSSSARFCTQDATCNGGGHGYINCDGVDINGQNSTSSTRSHPNQPLGSCSALCVQN